MRLNFLLFITMVFLTPALFGQQSPSPLPDPIADVLGVVTDKDGVGVPHAEVTFKPASETMRTHTRKNGFFHVKLRSGHYSVTICAVGFSEPRSLIFAWKPLAPPC